MMKPNRETNELNQLNHEAFELKYHDQQSTVLKAAWRGTTQTLCESMLMT